MTSYAHTSSTDSTSSTAAAASGAGIIDISPVTLPNRTLLATTGSGIDSNLNSKFSATSPLQDLSTPTPTITSDEYDCDSLLSDGHEKTDTTPENLKKIDDVIEQRSAESQHKYMSSSLTSAQFGVNDPVYVNIGDRHSNRSLTPASIDDGDDSSDKFSLCSKKGAFCISGQIESNVTPSSSSPANNKINASENENNYANDKTEVPPDSIDAAYDSESSIKQTTPTAAKKQACAFTIDTFNDKEGDPAAKAAKYKNMLERFQNRHRRGASLSKLDGNKEAIETDDSTISAIVTPTQAKSLLRGETASNHTSLDAESYASAPTPKVKLRARDRSTSRVRDSSKRHSWSPRSSTQEPTSTASTVSPHNPSQSGTAEAAKISNLPTYQGASKSSMSYTAVRTNTQPSAIINAAKYKPPPFKAPPKGTANLVANRTQFSPRSTAMKMALQEVDYLGTAAPLVDYKSVDEDDHISETGTYTLDGDNYTEEQKDLMNIDRSNYERKPSRPKNLNLQTRQWPPAAAQRNASKQSTARSSNVLEVSYYHETEEQTVGTNNVRNTVSEFLSNTHQSPEAYLLKLKSRLTGEEKLLLQADTKSQKSVIEEEDIGCFTSVTTSGVLAKQSALHVRPKISRKDSLSTSQIDSSEYVSNESKLKNASSSAFTAGGYTDRQKSEYRLNLFTNQKDSSLKMPSARSFRDSSPDSPSSKHADAVVLQNAQTKSDWIQEWARNARARSLANDTSKSSQTKHDIQDLMTRSYTCSTETGADSLNDDSVYNKRSVAQLNKTLAERYRLAGDSDFASDPTLSISKPVHDICTKPPKSPTKIPSPLHSIGRARSASRTRPSLYDFSQPEEESDIYLQKTAVAINNLQQSLSRKNSLLSSTHSASPRAPQSTRSPALNSSDECSPQHNSGLYGGSPRHKRNTSHDNFARTTRPPYPLMTSSYNEQQLKLLTTGDYYGPSAGVRKNSYDGSIGNSPVKKADRYGSNTHMQSGRSNAKGEQSSPLRRSSSFSAKVAMQQQQSKPQRPARPQFQNIYTPPAARHIYTLASGQSGLQVSGNLNLKKSSSSTSFRQVYSDYDENLQYYINDADDLGDDYYSSGAEEDEPPYNQLLNYDDEGEQMHRSFTGASVEQQVLPAAPVSNTRYNKALLMRIENSKQRVSGKSNAPLATSTKTANNIASNAGMIACPNTPELPRRNVRSAPRVRSARQSMPRDTSLNRLATQVPNSLDSAKKQLLQAAAFAAPPPTAAKQQLNQRVQPKYMDISKYKTGQNNNFLRKNDAKSTLKTPNVEPMRRSTSINPTNLNRADAARISNRSVKSMVTCMNTSTTSSTGSTRGVSAGRRDASVSKQKEAEMAMWKRRSTYDPMKAAAEDRRKKEEAKRLANAKTSEEVPCERPSRSPYRKGQF